MIRVTGDSAPRYNGAIISGRVLESDLGHQTRSNLGRNRHEKQNSNTKR